MAYVVRAYPLIRPIAELKSFLAELTGPRRDDTDAFYRQYGVAHESVYLQQSAQGALLLVVTQIADQHDASPRFRVASDAFQSWFKAQLLHLTGIDPNVTPLGPPSAEMFAWSGPGSRVAGHL